jgi:hypothetical protein
MSLEGWKTTFEIIGVALLFFSFLAGAGALIFSNKVSAVKDEQLRKFNKELTKAQGDLADAVARGKDADARILEAQRGATDANAKAEGFRLDIAKANEASVRAQAQVAGAAAEAAKATERAAEANAKAEEFRRDIAKANESAMKAEARAAEANLQLVRLKTPRWLTPEQQQHIASKISQFAGTPFDMWVNTDQDSTNLMGLILQAVTDGKWEFKPSGSSIEFGGKAGIIADIGVSVYFFGDRKDLETAALALANAINGEGITVKGCFRDSEKDAEANHRDKNNVHVMVGSKPLN